MIDLRLCNRNLKRKVAAEVDQDLIRGKKERKSATITSSMNLQLKGATLLDRVTTHTMKYLCARLKKSYQMPMSFWTESKARGKISSLKETLSRPMFSPSSLKLPKISYQSLTNQTMTKSARALTKQRDWKHSVKTQSGTKIRMTQAMRP